MGFRVKAKNVTVEVDSERELRSVLSILGVVSNGAVPTPATIASEQTSGERLLKFLNHLPEGYQVIVIRSLAKATVGLTDVELRQHLGLANNSQLAGIMAGLSKNAGANGLSYEDIVERQQRTDVRDGSKYFYKLTDGMRDVVSVGAD